MRISGLVNTSTFPPALYLSLEQLTAESPMKRDRNIIDIVEKVIG